MEFTKNNIDIAALSYVKQVSQSLIVSSTWSTLSSGVAKPEVKKGRPEWALYCYQKGDNIATIISVYAPSIIHPVENRKAFYN